MRASRTAGREELWAGLLDAAGAVRKKAMLCWEDGLGPQPAEPLACSPGSLRPHGVSAFWGAANPGGALGAARRRCTAQELSAHGDR